MTARGATALDRAGAGRVGSRAPAREIRHRVAHRRLGSLTGPAERPAGRAVRGAPPGEVELAVVLDLLDAASAGGAGLPRVLQAVGAAVGGERGRVLDRASRALLLGAPWPEAWPGDQAGLARVADALRPAWEDGVPVSRLLRTAAQDARRERAARATAAAARLGTRLVLPLGLCHLPAFVLVGIVPVLASMAVDALG